jgi:hypothetical protein
LRKASPTEPVVGLSGILLQGQGDRSYRKEVVRMHRRFSLSVAVILLLSSAGFAAIGQTYGHVVVASGYTATVGHCQSLYSYYYCGTVGSGQQTVIVGCSYQMIRWPCWWPCRPPCKPPCRPPSEPQCTAQGGDATATATAVSYGGTAQATAHAVGGDATVAIN